ncbi:aldo/keto reductase [Sinorhizobium meliloti]
MSSIGFGTGGIDGQLELSSREGIFSAFHLAVSGGINLIDTSDIYGFGEAEAVIGLALADLARDLGSRRSGLVICSKGGYFRPGTALLERRGRSLQSDLGIVRQCHSIHPAYLDNALSRSAARLRLGTIDAYLLHNPEEQLLAGPDQFAHRVRRAFEFLEQAVADGRILLYGISTADALLEPHPGPHTLDRLVGYARDVAGDTNHFKVVQVPFNLARPDALFRLNHLVAGRSVSTFEAAAHLGLAVITSVSVNGGSISKFIPGELREACPRLKKDIQIALQFARSAPGVCASLIGLRSVAHVSDVLGLCQTLPLAL